MSTPGVAAPRSRNSVPLLLLSIAFALGTSVASWYGVQAFTRRFTESKLAGKTPYERALIRAMKAEGVYRDYLALARRQHDSATITFAMATATRRGVTLLGPEDQARRIELLDHQLAQTPAHECAAIERGTAAAGRAALALITSMDSVTMDAFATIVARAFRLAEEHPDYRVPPVDHVETVTLLRTAGTGLPARDRARYFAAMSDLSAASDSEVCWWARTLNRYVLQEEAAARGNAVRLLTLAGSQEPAP